MFPVGLPADIQASFSDEGDTVYEPFSGSGSQFLAAEQGSRICRGVEIDPSYVAVALERMSLAGLEPKLAK